MSAARLSAYPSCHPERKRGISAWTMVPILNGHARMRSLLPLVVGMTRQIEGWSA